MAGTDAHWDVRLTDAAEADFCSVIDWTMNRFGKEQAEIYAGVVTAAIEALSDGPGIIGVKHRQDVKDGVYTLSVSRSGHKGRHLIAFNLGGEDEPQAIYVLRILHDSMDIERHLPSD